MQLFNNLKHYKFQLKKLLDFECLFYIRLIFILS